MAKPVAPAETACGERLRKLNNALGKTRAELSTYLGISTSMIGRYEQGKREPNINILAAYREHFGVNLNWLLTGEEEMFGATGKARPKIDKKNLEEAIKAVDIELGERPVVATEKARFISLAYDFLDENDKNASNSEVIGRVLKLVSSK